MWLYATKLTRKASERGSGMRPRPFERTFTVRNACDFPIRFEASGSLKTIVLPGDRTIVTAPGTTVTLTNLDEPEKQITVSVTASEHLTTQPDGRRVNVITGRILSWPPLELLVGQHTFLVNRQGRETEMLRSEGQVIDLCADLA
jgi:hypothetical protein